MRLEAEIETRCVYLAEKHGWFVRKIAYPGRKGCPDRIFVKGPRAVFIEFKRPTGGVEAVLQRREIDAIRDAGGEAHFCKTILEAMAVLGIDAV